MTAKTNAEKKAKAYAKKKAEAVKDFILPLGPKTAAQLEGLCVREGFEDWRELLTLMIFNTFEGRLPFEVPRHHYKPSKKVLKRLVDEGILQVLDDE